MDAPFICVCEYSVCVSFFVCYHIRNGAENNRFGIFIVEFYYNRCFLLSENNGAREAMLEESTFAACNTSICISVACLYSSDQQKIVRCLAAARVSHRTRAY